MTNDQIETAATDHASKYPEHLKTDIVLHYGLGIVRGLKEGSSGEGTIYVPVPTNALILKTDGKHICIGADGSPLLVEVFANEEFPFPKTYPIMLMETTLPQELAAKDKEIEKRDREIREMRDDIQKIQSLARLRELYS